MNKNQPYIIFTDKQKPKHRLVKCLRTFGIFHFTLTYASHLSTNSGWTIEQQEGRDIVLTNNWLGYTIDEAVKNIQKAKTVNRNGKEYMTF